MQTVVQTTSAHQVPHEVRIFPETPPRIPHGQETAKEGQEEEGQEEEGQEEQEQATREVAVRLDAESTSTFLRPAGIQLCDR